MADGRFESSNSSRTSSPRKVRSGRHFHRWTSLSLDVGVIGLFRNRVTTKVRSFIEYTQFKYILDVG